MRFQKPALSTKEQVELLLGRGMRGDRAVMLRRLEAVNYYRLSAYWYPFRKLPSDAFGPDAEFDVVWDHYLFDRRLRLLTLDAIERFEVTARTRLAYELAASSGPFGYADETHWEGDLTRHGAFRTQLATEIARSKEPFVVHFREKYGDEHPFPPVWTVVEMLSFGSVVTLYQVSPRAVRRRVADFFGVADPVMASWLRCVNVVRNICAHHGRLWNRELGVKPKLPRPTSNPAWHEPVQVGNERVFAPLTILAYTLGRVAPNSGWGRRLEGLLRTHPRIDTMAMGFPQEWRSCPIWAACTTGDAGVAR